MLVGVGDYISGPPLRQILEKALIIQGFFVFCHLFLAKFLLRRQ